MPDPQTFFDHVKRGDLEGMKAEIAKDPSLLNRTNESGQSALLLAKYYGQQKISDYLLSLHPTLDVFTAAAAGLSDQVLQAVSQDRTLLEKHSSDGWTPLHLAAYFGEADLVTSLLDCGTPVDVQSTNSMQNTPLHAAAAGRKLNAARVLLEHKADVNLRQVGGWTALHSAAQSGDRELVELLLAHGASVNARAENNQSPLDLAMMRGHSEIAALLEELGAKLQ